MTNGAVQFSDSEMVHSRIHSIVTVQICFVQGLHSLVTIHLEINSIAVNKPGASLETVTLELT